MVSWIHRVTTWAHRTKLIEFDRVIMKSDEPRANLKDLLMLRRLYALQYLREEAVSH
jgi:hypothetical protein